LGRQFSGRSKLGVSDLVGGLFLILSNLSERVYLPVPIVVIDVSSNCVIVTAGVDVMIVLCSVVGVGVVVVPKVVGTEVVAVETVDVSWGGTIEVDKTVAGSIIKTFVVEVSKVLIVESSLLKFSVWPFTFPLFAPITLWMGSKYSETVVTSSPFLKSSS